eukprot:GHVH01003772.1.p1 GENE.GHVH01003772.1~~GHVH01003772.1.p1  ORF type:complete len:703 (+),score=71.22 GHVH01003772.1:102-2111(+)
MPTASHHPKGSVTNASAVPKPTTGRLPDIRTADGIIEFYRRELSADNIGLNFGYEPLLPPDRIVKRDNLRKISIIAHNPLLTNLRIKKDLIPILREVQRQNPTDNETLSLVVDAYVVLSNHCGSRNSTKWLAPALVSFLENDERDVRNNALDGLIHLIRDMSNNEANKLYLDALQVALKGFVKNTAYQGRESACSVIGMFFPHVSESNQKDMRDMIVNLIFDESLIVQRKMADNLICLIKHPAVTLHQLTPQVAPPDVVASTDDSSFLNVAVYLPFQRTLHNVQRAQMLRVVQAISEKMTRQSDISMIVKLLERSVSDSSQLIRCESASLLPLFFHSITACDPSTAESLIIPCFSRLITDPVVEVREVALRATYACLNKAWDPPPLKYFLYESYTPKIPYEDDVERCFTEEEIATLFPSIVKAFYQDGKRSNAPSIESNKSEQRIIVANMISRLCFSLPRDTVEKDVLPIEMNLLLFAESPIEQTAAVLHSVSLYKKLNINTLSHMLVQTVLDPFSASQTPEIMAAYPGGTVASSNNNWRLRCAICYQLTVLAVHVDLSVVKTCEFCDILGRFMSDDVFSVREMAYQAAGKITATFGDSFFYSKVLALVVAKERVNDPLKSSSIFAWRKVCHLIKYAAPYLQSYDQSLSALLLKSSGAASHSLWFIIDF